MALIKCHDCGSEVSVEAKTCPKCGAKVKKPVGVRTILLVCLVTIVVLSMTVGGGTSPTNANSPSARDIAAHQEEVEADYARTPHIIPPLDVRPLDPKARSRAEKITTKNFCLELGKALRGKDEEFIRAMVKHSADIQAGILHLDHQNAIKSHQIMLGMTQCMALASWGRAERVNRSVGSYGTHEQWVYGEGAHNYLYFEDGILTSWQN